jgi:hypothetical protein
MVVCDEVCVWVVEGFPEDGEGSLRVLLEAPNCMAAAAVGGSKSGGSGGGGSGGGGGRSGGGCDLVVVAYTKGEREAAVECTTDSAGADDGGKGRWGRVGVKSG